MANPIARRLVPVAFVLGLTAACLFLSAGRLDWFQAWVLLGLNFISSVTTIALIWRDSELLAERSNTKQGKKWDKPLVGFSVLLGPMAMWITAGLDTRFGWSRGLPIQFLLAGVVAAVVGAALLAWSMRSNRFFSSIVRVQKDRGQTVVTAGPYGFVRHPGYAGAAVATLGTPLILGSWWALIPAGVTVAATVLRTVLEDRTLLLELDGYANYASKVRSRLVPCVW